MKRITIIIGNGFDLSLELKTKYSDFIKSSVFTERQRYNKLCNFASQSRKCNDPYL
ncbi:AbiH family protein [Xylanibacter ruminicola]|uniref:Bacteriophage abortive infection AbiH n=1 Tax=Xylanibacter ruminicola TaxID=839 RepID=A0A1M6XV23_XYLRU|nr:Bacteriophage abortive infection AbiH [Xylanibacter ruminicola]